MGVDIGSNVIKLPIIDREVNGPSQGVDCSQLAYSRSEDKHQTKLREMHAMIHSSLRCNR